MQEHEARVMDFKEAPRPKLPTSPLGYKHEGALYLPAWDTKQKSFSNTGVAKKTVLRGGNELRISACYFAALGTAPGSRGPVGSGLPTPRIQDRLQDPH